MKAKSIPPKVVGYVVAAVVLIVVLVFGLQTLISPPHAIEPVKPIDPNRIMGPWFEIARLDNALEQGHRPSLLLYRSGDRQFKLVLTRTNTESNPDGIWQAAADWTGSPDMGSITLHCLRLLRCGLHIIALDTDKFQWMMVTGPSRNYLWIFARVPGIEQSKFGEIREMAEQWGYDTGNLIVNNFPMTFPAVLPKMPETLPNIPEVKSNIPAQPDRARGHHPVEPMAEPMGDAPPMPEEGPPPMPEEGPPPMPEEGPPPMPRQGLPPMPEEVPPPMPGLPEK